MLSHSFHGNWVSLFSWETVNGNMLGPLAQWNKDYISETLLGTHTDAALMGLIHAEGVDPHMGVRFHKRKRMRQLGMGIQKNIWRICKYM